MMKPPVFGVHVGNSTASLAVYKEDGKIEVISNEIGDRVTPAVVTIMNDEKLVGSVSKSLSVQKFNCTVTNNKQLMNRSLTDVEKNKICDKSRVEIDYQNGDCRYVIPDGEKSEKYSPSQIATLIYKKLNDIAKSAVHAGEGDDVFCVVLVPTYFDSDSIEYTKGAVENAGWKILQIIKEPVAPVLAYSLLEKNSDIVTNEGCDEQFVLVYRLGGVTCEATVFRIYSGILNILGTSCQDNIAANHPIVPLTNYLAQEFYKKYKLDPSESPKSMGKLKQVAETCLHSLSNLNNADCFMESLYEGVDFKHSVSRARLDTYLTPLMSIYSEPINSVLLKTGLGIDRISKVILCGGLMKIPKLKSQISGMFCNAEVLSGIAPDEVLAYGAARQAGYLVSHKKYKFQGKVKNTNSLDSMLALTHPIEVTEEQVDVKIVNHSVNNVLFEKGTLIPSHKKVHIDCSKSEEEETFVFEVMAGDKKLNGELKITPEEDVNYEINVSLTVRKVLEIIFITKYRELNKRQTKIVHLKPVCG